MGAGRASSITRVLAWTLVALSACSAPAGDRAITVYGGQFLDAKLTEEIAPARAFRPEGSYLVAIAPSKVIGRPSEHAQWEVEGQLVKHFGAQEHWEVNGLIDTRWTSFPWNEVIGTSAAVGGGLSLASEVPVLEEELNADRGGSRNLLFYLMLELAFGPPKPAPWAIVVRVHHRSGIFGTFDGVHGGSNFMTLGLRYEF